MKVWWTSACLAVACLPLGCGGATPSTKIDDTATISAPGFSGLAGKRVAITSLDDAVAARLPHALSLRPAAPRENETQREADLRRLGDFRRLGDLFAVEPRSEWSDGRAARAELAHHAFAAALLERGITVVERERIARILGEQRLNGEDDPLLTDETRAQTHGVELLGCDYVLVGNPIIDLVSYDYSVRAGSLPLCLLLAPIALLVSESADLAAAREEGSLAVANPTFHDVRARHSIGWSVRILDVKSGQIVWIGSAYAVADQPSGLNSLLAGGGSISDAQAMESLAEQLVASCAGGAKK